MQNASKLVASSLNFCQVAQESNSIQVSQVFSPSREKKGMRDIRSMHTRTWYQRSIRSVQT